MLRGSYEKTAPVEISLYSESSRSGEERCGLLYPVTLLRLLLKRCFRWDILLFSPQFVCLLLMNGTGLIQKVTADFVKFEE